MEGALEMGWFMEKFGGSEYNVSFKRKVCMRICFLVGCFAECQRSQWPVEGGDITLVTGVETWRSDVTLPLA